MPVKLGKLFSVRGRLNNRNPETQADDAHYMPATREPPVDYHSAAAFDDSLKARNVFVQEKETLQQRDEEQRRRFEEQRQQRIRSEEAQRLAAEQRRRNEIAKQEAIQRNEKAKMDALRQRQLEQIKLNEQAEAKRKEWERNQNASPQSINRLRELMRRKYRLDVYIWNERRCLKADRPLIVETFTESDKILQEILFIVNAWDEDLFPEEEWKVAKKIKASFDEKLQYPLWGDVPPWDPKREMKRDAN